ncbi:MAG: DNA damage-inducible protein D [Planctomycetes bacterium]|nr:DNA damage-inducible protein D [Planctomycetota bacterium]
MEKGNIQRKQHKTFTDIRQTDDSGAEFWYARDLQRELEYTEWRNFEKVINKAVTSCTKSGYKPNDHFVGVTKKVSLGSGAVREIEDIELSRYACYLIVQNGDPTKPVIAHGQTYFALQTRRQELADDEKFQQLQEDEKRLLLRNELKEHNKQLVEAAQQAGVESHLDFAVFQDHGYRGLYGELGAKGIHKHKKLKKSHKILDHMGSTELAANLFRATQTEDKLHRENIQGKHKANRTHYEVESKVRKTIEELGGTMPEDLPVPDKGIKQIEKKQKKLSEPNGGQ